MFVCFVFSVTTCKSKWGTLRDYFFKKYRESKTTTSGQAASKKRKWYLFDTMSFLIPYYGSRETGGNLNYEDQQQDDDLDRGDWIPAKLCSTIFRRQPPMLTGNLQETSAAEKKKKRLQHNPRFQHGGPESTQRTRNRG